MTEKEKMLAGKIYDTSDEELAAMRLKAHKLSARYNSVFEDEEDIRNKILSELYKHKQQVIKRSLLCMGTIVMLRRSLRLCSEDGI